jgi:hypothetical protein
MMMERVGKFSIHFLSIYSEYEIFSVILTLIMTGDESSFHSRDDSDTTFFRWRNLAIGQQRHKALITVFFPVTGLLVLNSLPSDEMFT